MDQLAYTSPWRKHVSGTVEELNHMMSYVKWVDPRVRIMEITISKTLEIAHGRHSRMVSIVNAGGRIL